MSRSVAEEFESPASGYNQPLGRHVVWLGERRVEVDLNSRQDLCQLNRQLRGVLSSDNDEGELADGPELEKRAQRGLREIQRLIEALLTCTQPQERQKLQTLLLETAAALANLRRPPLPENLDFFQAPLAFLVRLSRPIARGDTLASNLQPGSQSDPSRRDPEPSTFWRRPALIHSRDLYLGFGRSHRLLDTESICSYAGPKQSYGRNPGFEVQCQNKKLKLKFAEISSEPFAARIFDALGYHTDPTDFSAGVKIRYSRRIFLEFNSRKALQTRFTFLGFVPMFTLNLQVDYDPFDYIRAAVLKDGTRWSGRELKRRLLRDSHLAHAELAASNYRPEIESAIDYLETVPANVQQRSGKNIGPWDFGQLDHASRRELRGAGLLAAWLGWFDTRFDNTRLRIVQHEGERELEHYFSDLGSVLGETTGILYARGELPNAFPWTFTQRPLWQGEHQLARPLRLTGYKPLARTPAFAAMTIDDARWMGRLICALSREQIEQALIASGFDSAEVSLYLAKLLSRRDQMIADLGLDKELGFTNKRAEDRHFSYDPISEGAVRMRIAGSVVEAPVGTNRVVSGKLVPAQPQMGSRTRKRAGAPIGFSF